MKFKRWTPINELQDDFYLEGLYDDYEGFRILLRGEEKQNKILKITFDPALSYRNTDEGDLLRTIGKGLGDWSLFIVEGSEYLDWFNKESHDIYQSKNITHYAIYTQNDCIDILSAYHPKVEWLD